MDEDIASRLERYMARNPGRKVVRLHPGSAPRPRPDNVISMQEYRERKAKRKLYDHEQDL